MITYGTGSSVASASAAVVAETEKSGKEGLKKERKKRIFLEKVEMQEERLKTSRYKNKLRLHCREHD